MKEILIYVFLGIVQGLTEPLPISSSGHVFVLKKLLGITTSDLNFEIVVNFGSLLAILLIYKDDLIKLIKNFFMYFKVKNEETKRDFKYCWLIVLGSIPVGIMGLLFKDVIEEKLNNMTIVGIAFLVTSLFLLLVSNIRGKRKESDMNIMDSFVIGLTQVVALIPGISRSGSTLIGGLFRKLDRETALKYSFMLYIPISVASMVLGVKDLITAGNIGTLAIPYLISMIAAGIVTYYAAKLFIDIMKKGKLIYFSIYCFIVGLIVFIIF